jgi:chemotaxis signal transduction protein
MQDFTPQKIQQQKHLRFYCGEYALLLPLDHIVEIVMYHDNLCSPSHNSFQHHGSNTPWRDSHLPYVDLRLTLQVSSQQQYQTPSHVMVISKNDHTPAVMIAVDSIDGIVDISSHTWHYATGINHTLDIFFDRLSCDNNTLMMRLADPTQWLAHALCQHTSGTHHAD